LYRGLKAQQYDRINKKVSSVVFRDSKGTSVDRAHNRNVKECVDGIIQNPKFIVVIRLTAEQARSTGARVYYDHLENNLYHSLICDQKPEILCISKPIAHLLVKCCEYPPIFLSD